MRIQSYINQNLFIFENQTALRLQQVLQLVLILLVCLSSLATMAQKTEKEIHDYFPSENIDARKDFNKKENRPKEKRISFIVKNNTTRILYGNPCIIDETHRMGFEYSIQIPGLPGSVRPIPRIWRNSGVWFRLIFTRGPWWKLTLNRRVKDCRKRSGDLVG